MGFFIFYSQIPVYKCIFIICKYVNLYANKDVSEIQV